ncbi:uncharacterized protein LOC144750567 [Ciona intestinalis]
MEAIMEKMASFEEMFLQLKNKQDEYESGNANSKNDDAAVAVITGSPELKEMRKMLNGLETSLKDRTALVKRTDDRLDDLEQYGRRNCLIVHGSRRVPGDRNSFLHYDGQKRRLRTETTPERNRNVDDEVPNIAETTDRREGQNFFWIPERLDSKWNHLCYPK